MFVWGARGREFKSPRPDHFNTAVNTGENEVSAGCRNKADLSSRTDSAQKPPESGAKSMRFPVIIRHRKAEAKIYGKSKNYPFYRVAAYVGGKRRMASYGTYSEAKDAADNLVRDIANGSQAAALTAGQANDALAALERLDGLYRDTGRRVSLMAVASEYAEAARKLNGHTLGEAVVGFLSTVAMIKRVDLTTAIEQFIESRKLKTVAKDGKRPQLSSGWHYIIAMWLREFAKTFPGHAVCDLNREHLTAYVNGHGEVSARTRNGRRNAVKMFLKWCVERDYLTANHRLLIADGMAKEVEDFGDVEFYTPKELRILLDTASQRAGFRSLFPVITLGGLAGLRLQEIVRLTWADVWRVPGHIEITAGKAKTRQRRLVEICPALAQWLESFCGSDGNVWAGTLDGFHDLFGDLRDELGIPARRNGLRHAFCTYHFALHANENLTAALAGNSPAMIHAHYKGLATKAEAEKWFNVMPPKSAKNAIPLNVAIE